MNYFFACRVAALWLALTTVVFSSDVRKPAPAKATPPLGLPRIASDASAPSAASISASKISVDTLLPQGGAALVKDVKSGIDYVAIEPGREWVRPLRGNARDVSFISFHVYASQTTIIEIGGIRLGATMGPVVGGLQLMYDDNSGTAPEWKSLNLYFQTDKYKGKDLAALPVITIRMDPSAGVWDLFAGSWLMADNLPLPRVSSASQFRLRAGSGGAWIMGLVQSDENPLFVDTNANGVDDTFESRQPSGLLPAATSISARKSLVQSWKSSQRAAPPVPIVTRRPASDNSGRVAASKK